MVQIYIWEHYGDIASVLGLFVTFGGFVATILSVRKAKRAAEEAQKAAREAVLRLKSRVLVDEITTGLRLISSIDSACKDHRWKEADERSDEARALLSQIQAHQALFPDELAAVKKALDDLGGIMRDIQKIKKSKSSFAISPQKSKRLHEIIVSLGQLQGRLRNQVFEV